jgi:hypothetical protein
MANVGGSSCSRKPRTGYRAIRTLGMCRYQDFNKGEHPGTLPQSQLSEQTRQLGSASEPHLTRSLRLLHQMLICVQCVAIIRNRDPRLTRSKNICLWQKKNPHAVALGRVGGRKSGKARMEKLTPRAAQRDRPQGRPGALGEGKKGRKEAESKA